VIERGRENETLIKKREPGNSGKAKNRKRKNLKGLAKEKFERSPKQKRGAISTKVSLALAARISKRGTIRGSPKKKTHEARNPRATKTAVRQEESAEKKKEKK